MKKTILLLTCIIALLGSGCKKCPTTTHYPFPAATELYFGVYKKGNWWTYENQDGTKKDSIYFSSFDKNEEAKDKDGECVTWGYRQGNIENDYLYSKVGTGKNYISFSYENPYKGGSTPTTYIGLESGLKIFAIYQDGIFKGDTILPVFLQNSVTYNNVLKNQENMYFAPNIGLIRWISQSKQDTFTIKNYYIQ